MGGRGEGVMALFNINKSTYTAQDPWSTVQLPLLSRLY